MSNFRVCRTTVQIAHGSWTQSNSKPSRTSVRVELQCGNQKLFGQKSASVLDNSPVTNSGALEVFIFSLSTGRSQKKPTKPRRVMRPFPNPRSINLPLCLHDTKTYDKKPKREKFSDKSPIWTRDHSRYISLLFSEHGFGQTGPFRARVSLGQHSGYRLS